MKNYRQQLDTLFHKAQASSAGDRLLSQDDIRNLLGNSASSSQPTPYQGIRPMVLASAATGLATLITAGALFFPTDRTETPTQPAAEQHIQQNVQQPDLAMALPPADQPQPVAATRGVDKHGENTNTPGQAAFDIRGIRMLELTNDELLALGLERTKDGELIVYNKQTNGDVTFISYSMKGTTMSPTAVSNRTFSFFSTSNLRMITDNTGMRRMTSYTTSYEVNENKKVTESREAATLDGKQPRLTTIEVNDPPVINGKPVTMTVFVPNHKDIKQSTVIEAFGSGTNQESKERPATAQEISEFQESTKRQEAFDKNLTTHVRASHWIAVSVPMGIPYTEQDSLNKRWRPDLVLWFEPTAELISHLPERYRRDLETELRLADIAEEASTNLAQKPGPGEAYFGVWQTRSGAIKESAVFPNPVKDHHATLRYTLDKQRTVGITLRNVTGTVLRKLSLPQSRSAGEQTAELSLDGLTPGMYLVTIETDNNEYAVQRLILE